MMIVPSGKPQSFISLPTLAGHPWIQISVLFFYSVCVYFIFISKKRTVPEGGSLVAGLGEEHKQDKTFSCHCILDLICSNARSWLYLTSCCVRVLSVSWKVWRTLYLLCLKHKKKRPFSFLKETPEQFVLYIRGKCLVSWSLPDSL